MNSPISDAISALPCHITPEELELIPGLLSMLSSKMESYDAQGVAVFFMDFLKHHNQPPFGFELAIDREDGVYYLYCGGEDGIQVNEEAFETDEALNDFCAKKNAALEDFAQQLNDSPWREKSITEELVESLNHVQWAVDEVDDVIAAVLSDYDIDGHAFIGSVKAHYQATELTHTTPIKPTPKNRRSL